jgi:hypothetical protein
MIRTALTLAAELACIAIFTAAVVVGLPLIGG